MRKQSKELYLHSLAAVCVGTKYLAYAHLISWDLASRDAQENIANELELNPAKNPITSLTTHREYVYPRFFPIEKKRWNQKNKHEF